MNALHPAAQSILDAYQSELTVEDGLAAVVEKIADLKYPDSPNPKWYEPVRPHLHNQTHRKDLLQLARLLREEHALPSSTQNLSPTDEELDELASSWYSKTGSTWYQIAAFRGFARAVLARWGAQ